MPKRFQRPSAVVIVDMWQDGCDPYVLRSLLKFIQQDFVKCIVIASYTESLHHGTQSTVIEYPIWHNSRQIFNPKLNPAVPHYTGSVWLAQEHAQEISGQDHVLSQFALCDSPVTDRALLNVQLAHDQKMFAAWTPDQLVYLLNSQYPKIENIYMCGGSLEQCLQDRPLGLRSLSTALNLTQFDNVKNLLILPACVYTNSGLSLNDCPELIDPGWYYDKNQCIIHVQSPARREPTTSNDVLAALKFTSCQLSTVDFTVDNQQAALDWARLETQKRRGVL